MENAKRELLNFLSHKNIDVWQIDAAHIEWNRGLNFKKEINLKLGYLTNDWRKFWDELNFEYDSRFGHQYVHGIIWLTGGSWIERVSEDGAEEWMLRQRPTIPEHLT